MDEPCETGFNVPPFGDPWPPLSSAPNGTQLLRVARMDDRPILQLSVKRELQAALPLAILLWPISASIPGQRNARAGVDALLLR